MLLSTKKPNSSTRLVWLMVCCALISGLGSHSASAMEIADATHAALEIATPLVGNVIVGLPGNAVYQANDEVKSIESVLTVAALRQLTGVLQAMRGQAKSHRPANAVIGLRG